AGIASGGSPKPGFAGWGLHLASSRNEFGANLKKGITPETCLMHNSVHHRSTEIAMLEIGTTAEASYVADDDDMAGSFCIAEHDVFPQVFSTARMIALMETAGARAL